MCYRARSTGGNPVRLSILWVKACAGRPIWFRPLKLTFSNKNCDSEWPYISRLNRNFSSYSVSEAVRGIFLPPPKLRPQKIFTMFTNRKGVYKRYFNSSKSYRITVPNNSDLVCSLIDFGKVFPDPQIPVDGMPCTYLSELLLITVCH